jgi:hypothetical protein
MYAILFVATRFYLVATIPDRLQPVMIDGARHSLAPTDLRKSFSRNVEEEAQESQ